MCAGEEEFSYYLSVAFVCVLVGLLLEMLRCGMAENCVCRGGGIRLLLVCCVCVRIGGAAAGNAEVLEGRELCVCRGGVQILLVCCVCERFGGAAAGNAEVLEGRELCVCRGGVQILLVCCVCERIGGAAARIAEVREGRELCVQG